MKNKTTHYQIILDSSGSMSDCRHATISTFNEHLQSIQAIQKEFKDQNIRVSLTYFNGVVTESYVDRMANEVNPLSDETYHTMGSTKLLDAVGKCIQRMEFVHGKDIEEDKASVIFLILTDGEENASQIFNYQQVASMIERLKGTGKWTFTFLGADVDLNRMGDLLRIQHSHRKTFNKTHMQENIATYAADMRGYMESKERGEINFNLS